MYFTKIYRDVEKSEKFYEMTTSYQKKKTHSIIILHRIKKNWVWSSDLTGRKTLIYRTNGKGNVIRSRILYIIYTAKYSNDARIVLEITRKNDNNVSSDNLSISVTHNSKFNIM